MAVLLVAVAVFSFNKIYDLPQLVKRDFFFLHKGRHRILIGIVEIVADKAGKRFLAEVFLPRHGIVAVGGSYDFMASDVMDCVNGATKIVNIISGSGL